MWIDAVERVRSSRTATAAAALMLALLYILLGRLTFAVSVEHSNVTSVVFAPEGLALAFAILFGPRVAWGVLVGQTVLSVWSGPSVLGGAAIGMVNTLECALGAVLFARMGISARFNRPRDVALFVALVFLILQPVSATGGVSVLWGLGVAPTDWLPDSWQHFWIHGLQRPIADASEIPSAWAHWWIGNSVGQILVAPLLLAWATKGGTRRPESRMDLAVSAAAIGFTGFAATAWPIHPLLMLGVTYPLLVWIGLRRGLRGVTTTNVLITAAVTWAGASGHGFLSHLSVPDRLTYVGYFVATACIFSLMLFAMFEERRLLVEQLNTLVRQDSLLPLSNRRHFVEHLQQLLDIAAVATGRNHSLAVVMFDIDNFKGVNDAHGHAVGDLTLIAVANTCRAHLRGQSLVARIGGEEFAVVLPGSTTTDAERVAERLRAAIAGQHTDSGGVPITVSAGVAAWRRGDSLDDLLNRADAALYTAKHRGRDRVMVHDAEDAGPSVD